MIKLEMNGKANTARLEMQGDTETILLETGSIVGALAEKIVRERGSGDRKASYTAVINTLYYLLTEYGERVDEESEANMQEVKMFTVNEAMQELGVQYTTILRYIRIGKLQAVKTTKGNGYVKWLIPESEIERVKTEKLS